MGSMAELVAHLTSVLNKDFPETCSFNETNILWAFQLRDWLPEHKNAQLIAPFTILLTAGYKLTAHSVLRLFGSCPHLQCVGDLRYWSISFEDRREMFRQMQTHQGCRKMVNHCIEMSLQNHGIESPWIKRIFKYTSLFGTINWT